MTMRNDKMAALLADGPARDMAFEIAVLARIEQRRFVRSMARNLLAACGAALLLALVMPRLAFDIGAWSNALSALSGNTLVMLALLVAAFAAWRLRPGAEV
jgi:hypothetical protein